MDRLCTGCHGKELYEFERIGPIGGYGFLPGIGKLWSGVKFKIVVCIECGLMQFYAGKDACEEIVASKKWRKIQSPMRS